jgi:hypothetical protein
MIMLRISKIPDPMAFQESSLIIPWNRPNKRNIARPASKKA